MRQLTILTLLAVALTTCGTPAPSRAIDQRLVAADTRFGIKLLQQLVATAEDQNVFLSPTSIALALTLLHNGAAGPTRQALAATLELHALSPAEIDAANARLLQLLRAPAPGVQVEIANAIWTQTGLKLQPAFRTQSQTVYGAELAETDFSSPAAVETINRWVADQTHGKIATLFDDDLDPATVVVLANSLSFKGAWRDPFEPHLTEELPFVLPDGSSRPVPMMIRAGRYRYLQADTFQAIALPYKGGRSSLYVFVPRAASGLPAFVEQLTEARWATWMEQFHEEDKVLWLPKLTVTSDVELNQPLTALGMGIAFEGERADFSRMVAGPLAVGLAKHKTVVEINERGTEAAAGTGATVATSAAPEEKIMKVDRPFLVAIRDDVTGAVLFLGAISDPRAPEGAW